MKGTGGRRCSPLGEAIRRPDRRGGINGVSDLQVSSPKSQLSKPYMSHVWQILVVLVSIGLATAKLRREVGKVSNFKASLAFITPLIFPPRAPRSPPDRLPERGVGLLEVIKILIIF